MKKVFNVSHSRKIKWCSMQEHANCFISLATTNSHNFKSLIKIYVVSAHQHYHEVILNDFLSGLMLNVPVNNFSFMLGRSHRFLGITSTFFFGGGEYMSCSRIQYGDLSED